MKEPLRQRPNQVHTSHHMLKYKQRHHQIVPSKQKDLVNLNSPLSIGYSGIELEPDDIKHDFTAKPPRHVTPSDPILKATGPNPMYQNMNQHHNTLSTTDVSQGNDIYTVPDTTSSHTVDRDSSLYETVYSEPIQPSLFHRCS